MLQTSPVGKSIIQAFESCLKPTGDGRFRTYHCPANVLTIGWGSTRDDVPDLRDGDVWSRERCDGVFATSLARKYEPHVRDMVGDRDLATYQFDALVSWAYNCGGPASSSVWKAVREGRDADVPALLAQWNKGGGQVLAGLVRRRKSEGLLYAGNIPGALNAAGAVDPGTMPQSKAPADHPEERSTKDLQTRLNTLGFGRLATDGAYGPATKRAVSGFQRRAGLHVDGIAGGLTWAALDAAITKH